MRMSEVFNMNEEKKKKKFIFRFLFLISGLVALTVILVTIYGQYTGTYLIGLTRDAEEKGIILSTNYEFSNPQEKLIIDPVENVLDMKFSWIKDKEAESTDGQFVDTEYPHYVAYTFYIKNIGNEIVDLDMRIQLISEYNSIGDATILRVREFRDDNGNFNLIREVEYQKNLANNLYEGKIIGGSETTLSRMENFRVNEIRKFTIYLWVDGSLTNKDMMGGAIKFDFSFAIATDLEEEI